MKRKSKKRSPVADALAAAAFWTLIRFIWLLPWPVAIALGKAIGLLIWKLGGRRPRRVMNQIRLVYGDRLSEAEQRHLARESYKHFGIGAIEIVKQPQITAKNLTRFFRGEDIEAFLAAAPADGGAIMAASHLGPYTIGAQMLALVRPLGCAALHREIDNPRMEAMLAGLRGSSGLELISKFASFLEVRKAVNRGRIVGLIIDQDGGKRGIFSDFLGYPASTWTSVAEAHLLMKCPIVIAATWREGYGPRLRIEALEVIAYEPPPDGLDKAARRDWQQRRARELTDRVNEVLGRKILEHPAQWLWVHRRWKSRPKGDRVQVIDGVPCPWLGPAAESSAE
jgi:KDO2-lipid IV(A) lauroyltransferase